jgi:U3 small nucleolar RNA-associated protein 21
MKINKFEFESEVESFQLYGETALVLLKDCNKVALRNFVTGQSLSSLVLPFVPKILLHPLTYLNKIVLYGEGQLALYNLNTGNPLFSFDSHPPIAALLEKGEVTHLQNTPAVDIIGIVLSSGHIGLINLKSGAVLKLFLHSDPVADISFSTDITRDGLLAVADKTGRITLYSLEKEEVICSLKHGECLTFVKYLSLVDKDMFITGSEQDNSIKLWNKQDPEDIKYYVLRTRAGSIYPLKSIKFYDEEGLHILGYSLSENSEIVDFSILREDMTTHISSKQSKQSEYHLATERDANIGQVMDLASSTNRARDWPNMITANKKNLRPCLWDVENKTIVKLNVSLFDSARAKRQNYIEDLGRKNRLITRVTITNCGNFGVAGFTDGYIVKMSMQTGTHIKTFFNKNVHQDREIKGIIVDSLNHFMVTADYDTLGLWDFYSGLFQRKMTLENFSIHALVPDSNSVVFGVSNSQSQVNLVEFHSLKTIRTFTLEKGQISDCIVLFEERKMILATTAKELAIFDIFTEKCVSKFKLEKNITAMTIDKDLNYLATTYEGEKHIRLWHINKLSLFLPHPLKVKFKTRLAFVGEDKRKHYFGPNQESSDEEELKDVDEELYREIEEALESGLINPSSSSERSKLLTFTDVPQNRWMPLNYLEEIEKRNKPETHQTVEVPFFLNFDNPLNRMKQEVGSSNHRWRLRS